MSANQSFNRTALVCHCPQSIVQHWTNKSTNLTALVRHYLLINQSIVQHWSATVRRLSINRTTRVRQCPPIVKTATVQIFIRDPARSLFCTQCRSTDSHWFISVFATANVKSDAGSFIIRFNLITILSKCQKRKHIIFLWCQQQILPSKVT